MVKVRSTLRKGRFARLARKAQIASAEMTKDMADDLARHVRREVPVRTGRLRRSIRVVAQHQGADATARVEVGGATAPYAGYVEDRRQYMEAAVQRTERDRKRILRKKARDLVKG